MNILNTKKFIVAGFRKGAKDNSAYNFNVHLYTEEELRYFFSWIDGEDADNFRSGTQKLSLEDLIKEVKSKGTLRCESDFSFYLIKAQ